MTEPAVPVAPAYARTIAARWGDMDFNGHMRNTAYLDAAGDTRMRYFADHGFTVPDFERLQVGPVILRDTLEYYKELHLLEEVEVLQTATGMSDDGSHFRIRNAFRRPDGQRIAKVESTGGWLDLRTRRLAAPPPELKALLHSMPRAPDFEVLDSLLRR
jgi:acyl-CoA thioester hydrolase